MKKVIASFFCILTLFAFAACSSTAKSPDVEAIMKEIRSGEIDLPDMAEIPLERISGYYDVNSDDIEQLSYIIAGSGATPDEIMIVKFTSADKAESMRSKMEERKAQISDLFTDYNPDEMPKVNSCVIETKNEYAFFAICNDNQKAKDIFSGSF